MANEKIILPYVLECLSLRPNSTQTYSHLEGQVQSLFSHDTDNSNIQDALKRALNTGRNLGIVVMKNNEVRLPFALGPRKHKRAMSNVDQLMVEQPHGSAQQKETTKRKQPQNIQQKETHENNAVTESTENLITDIMNELSKPEEKSRKRTRNSFSRTRNAKRRKSDQSSRPSGSRCRGYRSKSRSTVRRRK